MTQPLNRMRHNEKNRQCKRALRRHLRTCWRHSGDMILNYGVKHPTQALLCFLLLCGLFSGGMKEPYYLSAGNSKNDLARYITYWKSGILERELHIKSRLFLDDGSFNFIYLIVYRIQYQIAKQILFPVEKE